MWGGCSGCLRPFTGPGYVRLSAMWVRRLRVCTGVKDTPPVLCTPCWRRLLVAYRFRRLCRASARILRQTVKKQIIKKEENVSDVKFELFNQSSKNDWEGFEEPNDFHFNSDLYDQGESLCDFKSVYCESIQPINQDLISKTEDNTVIHFPLETDDYIEENNEILHLEENEVIDRFFKCEICYNCFSNDTSLEHHLKDSHFDYIERSPENELPLKIILKNDQILYKCIKCCQEFPLIHVFKEHVQQHYDVNTIIENSNQFTFLNSNQNEENSVNNIDDFKIRNLTAENNAVASNMDETLLLTQPDHFVIQRIENRVSLDDSEVRLSNKSVASYKMEQCKFCFKHLHRSSLLKHVRESHAETLAMQNRATSDDFSKTKVRYAPKALLKCPKCGKKFKLSHILDAHMRQHYGLKPFVCQICFKELSNQKTFKMHMNRHNGRRNYVCNVCDKVFAYPTALEMHKRIHLGIRKFVCKECNASFTQSSHLKSHISTHSTERPYSCNHCDKSFKTNSLLKCHMERHKGLRNYVCSECGKSFLTSGELNVHVRSHSSDKLFSCLLCNSVFKTRRQLLEHNRKHTGERPFKCDTCFKEFMTSQVLKRHYMTHTGVKPHVCHLCNSAYTQKYKLNKHLETHKQTLQGICFET
ncbi:uncharacterized protein LOC143920554 [Arctopsyche grandis]|uniref:uncharacterized protein LOC143920554 n=1 Tax=Arctopsyche grandis TaxID=121162 RepID=UPI00406D9647